MTRQLHVDPYEFRNLWAKGAARANPFCWPWHKDFPRLFGFGATPGISLPKIGICLALP
jgi:hypothetical protein